MNKQENIKAKISQIEKTRYNNYKEGSYLKRLGMLNQIIRKRVGDKEFLKYLEELEDIYPKPINKLPS